MKERTTSQHWKRVLATCAVFLWCGTTGNSAAVAQEDSGLLDAISDWFSSTGSEGVAPSGVTPSHVFQAVQDLTSEINILRDEMGVYDYPPEAELHEDRAPVHVYAKTLELHLKVRGVQNRFGVEQAPVGQIPFKEVQPSDVLANVALLVNELRKVKDQMVIERQIEPAPLVGGKTPSLVYQALANASLLLDGLRGRALAPDDVYLNAMHILDELELIAARQNVPMALDAPPVEGTKRPTDVAQQVLRASYKVVRLQTRLGMDASGVPNLTLVRVTPTEVFDSTNMLLAEMARIKFHLGIDVPRDDRAESRGKTPNDVFGLVLLMIENLDRISGATER